MHRLKSVLVGLSLLSLAGCGGGSGNPGSPVTPASPTPSAASVYSDLETTNLSSSGFPWGNIADGRLKRWPYETSLIPVKANGSAEAIYAMNLIEATLGRTIFDRSSIASVADAGITRGLIVSMGTAVGPGGVVNSSACGNVSAAPGDTSYPTSFVDSNGNLGARLYINIGSSGCPAENRIAVHEFGHALGLGPHFSGYGLGDVIGGNFWNVLKTVYFNPVGATVGTIQAYVDVVAGNGNSGTIGTR